MRKSLEGETEADCACRLPCILPSFHIYTLQLRPLRGKDIVFTVAWWATGART